MAKAKKTAKTQAKPEMESDDVNTLNSVADVSAEQDATDSSTASFSVTELAAAAAGLVDFFDKPVVSASSFEDDEETEITDKKSIGLPRRAPAKASQDEDDEFVDGDEETVIDGPDDDEDSNFDEDDGSDQGALSDGDEEFESDLNASAESPAALATESNPDDSGLVREAKPDATDFRFCVGI